jgi:DNA repair photolyase
MMIRRAQHPGRLFIDITEEGCRCGCVYCYVEKIVGTEVLLDQIRIATLADQLRAHPDYVPGPDGTLLAIGTHSDLFRTPVMFQGFLLALRLVAPLGNPIQISTKQFIQPRWAAEIADIRTYPTQVIIFISCATIEQSERYEPHTAPPARRFASFGPLRRHHIPTCLFIKPFLPTVTDREAAVFVEVIRNAQPDAVCVGALYLNELIAQRLNLINARESLAERRHPLMPDSMGAVDPTSKFFNELQVALPAQPIFRSSACVVAYLNKTFCSTHIWKRLPQLCIECQDCGMFYHRITQSELSGT